MDEGHDRWEKPIVAGRAGTRKPHCGKKRVHGGPMRASGRDARAGTSRLKPLCHPAD
ncbi:hypothetical protein ISN76_13385 [Dyella halodurans]|uniref:Uncharacterized protein n=1 Tax=Dyella halodurans TaxID=1920171 RepID=A0ABV9C3X7_9GAMM|nr:hypothetical protein [Dyella halodurans]